MFLYSLFLTNFYNLAEYDNKTFNSDVFYEIQKKIF